MLAAATTNDRKGSVAPISYKRKVRLLLWGGAANPGDNSAFEFAEANVMRDYKNADKGNFSFVERKVFVAKDIVKAINDQEADSIRSLDIWTHGGPQALYLTTAAPPPPQTESTISRYVYQARRWGLHNSSLYRTRTNMILQGAGWTEGSAVLSSIDFTKFSKHAKVELHGCRTADDEGDNIASDISRLLHKAGKTHAVVIAHTDRANPNIRGGGEPLSQQDYRHGPRAIISNGKVTKTSSQTGFIAEPKAIP